MKIQSVNNNINFGRVIEIKSATNPEFSTDRMKLDNSTYKIHDILNSNNVTGYSKEEQNSIRKFFKDVLEDYNGHNGILIRRFGKNRIALISGSDFDYFNKMEKRYKNDINHLYIWDDAKIKKRKSEFYKEFDSAIMHRLEDGKSKKSESLIQFDSSQCHEKNTQQFSLKAKINRFKYTLFNQIYQLGEDGHSDEKGLTTKKNTDMNAYAVINYYENELKL